MWLWQNNQWRSVWGRFTPPIKCFDSGNVFQSTNKHKIKTNNKTVTKFSQECTLAYTFIFLRVYILKKVCRHDRYGFEFDYCGWQFSWRVSTSSCVCLSVPQCYSLLHLHLHNWLMCSVCLHWYIYKKGVFFKMDAKNTGLLRPHKEPFLFQLSSFRFHSGTFVWGAGGSGTIWVKWVELRVRGGAHKAEADWTRPTSWK